jgi:hypothetical protein
VKFRIHKKWILTKQQLLAKAIISAFSFTGIYVHLIPTRPECCADAATRLWGNPSHLQYLHDTLRARHDDSVLQLLVCQRNAGRNTYDGIETGGERVAREIEDAIEEFARNGVSIRKLSIVGYSLGGRFRGERGEHGLTMRQAV